VNKIVALAFMPPNEISKNYYIIIKSPVNLSDIIKSVLRIRIRIRMDPHGFGLLDPHPESAFQMRIPDADADPGKAT
jgi:hypothetical protein